MSDAVMTAMIGVGSSAVGAIATIIVARIQVQNKARAEATEKVQITPVLGESVDIRELRILRALYGEPSGRLLEAYKTPYYRPAIQAVLRKRWANKIEDRYHMTKKGTDFCTAYLKE